MVEGSFLASAALGWPLAIAFLVVGTKLHRRGRLERRPALMFFAAFWVGLGAYALAESAWSMLHLAGLSPLPVALLVLHVKLVATVVGFAGLVTYLLSIHEADPRLRGLVLGAYGVLLALTATFYTWRGPIDQAPHTWGMRLVYANNDVEPWWTLLLILLFVPPFVATISYASLLRQARDPELRYRIKLTSASLFLFFAPLLFGWRAGNLPWWGAVEKALAIAMAVGIVLAKWPPPRVRRWLARQPMVDFERVESELQRRASDLI